MPRSRAFRQKLSQPARRPLSRARSKKRTMPAPNSIEKSPMNFWSTKISPAPPMAQSSQVSMPPAPMFQ